MRKILQTLVISLALATGLAASGQDVPPATDVAASAQPSASATGFVQSKADLLLTIVNAAAVDRTQLETKREELRQALREFLSFDVLAERSLGDHWQGLSPEQRAEFVTLLRDLIETSYSRSLGTGSVDAGQYAVQFSGERSRNDRTTVEATVTVDGEAHVVEVKMQANGESWIVYDLVTDDVSLEESYAESFDSIIAEDGWDGLLRRMRDRLAEMRAEL